MDYTKITSHLLHSERVIDATDFEFRTWIYLLHYCVEHETGGVLRGAKQWPREKWLAQTGAEYPRFNDVKGNLYGVEGNDVWVAFYPDYIFQKAEETKQFNEKRVRAGSVKSERKALAVKENGKRGGRPKKNQTPKPNTET